MTIAEQLINNFPNSINKSAKVFSSLVANDKKKGVFEQILNSLKIFCEDWTDTPNMYDQTGEMLELTSNFFTYFERYTDESEEAYKKRIQTIFFRNKSDKWGGPFDVKNVFREYFPNAKIYMLENINDIEDETKNLIVDGDFTDRQGDWTNLSNDPSSNCYLDKYVSFSKSYGAVVKNNGYFYQEFSPDLEDTEYNVQANDTFKKISKYFYGTEDFDEYIKNSNPDIEEPLVQDTKINIPPLNTYYLHFFLNGCCGVQFINQNGKYWNPKITYSQTTKKWQIGKWQNEEYTIEHETISFGSEDSVKASVKLQFSRNDSTYEFRIPYGTIVSDGVHEFETVQDAILKEGSSTTTVMAKALVGGTEYNVAANTITTIVTELEENLTVNNPSAGVGGLDYSWENQSDFFVCDNSIESVKIKFIGNNQSDGVIDFVKLYEKGDEPSFEIIAHYNNEIEPDAAALFPGQEDTGPLSPTYQNASYIDNTYFTGVSNGGYALDLYKDLLEYVKAVGVKAYIEIVNKDEVENE